VDPNALIQAVDASIDEALVLIQDIDMTTLDPIVAQALALVQAAGVTIDEYMEACGIYDADEPAVMAQEGQEDPQVEMESAALPMRAVVPTENLLRATMGGVELRENAEGAPVLYGHFSMFNQPYEIDSAYEGRFLEMIDPKAFAETIQADKSNMRVLYDHGFDPAIGNKPLGPIEVLQCDAQGAYYEVPLLDTDYNRNFVLPALRGQLMDGRQVGSVLGASFRFQVQDEQWTYPEARTSSNPEMLPERRITRAKVFEFGPVTFPANPGATAGVRSLTDEFIDKLHHDPKFVARMTERVGATVVERMLAATPGDARNAQAPSTAKKEVTASADGQRTPRSTSQRRALAILAGAMNPLEGK